MILKEIGSLGKFPKLSCLSLLISALGTVKEYHHLQVRMEEHREGPWHAAGGEEEHVERAL